MKKIGVLNNELSLVISEMGHMDMLAIGDCGLPIPFNTKRIDLALIKNIPSFIDTLKAIESELQFEEVIIATETKEISPNLYKEIESLVANIKVTFVSHENFKKLLIDCKAVVRTGEQTPYANIILKSGVVF